MALLNNALARTGTNTPYALDATQTLRASTALLHKLQNSATESVAKPSLLADADDDDAEDQIPIWLVLTTKKHIVDKKRLKPGKIVLPHPYLDLSDDTLRICLITADPQRKYKDLIAHPAFPEELGKRIQRVIGLEKLKAKYKTFEMKRRLLGEYDVFLADDRVITYLPQILGKVFYKGGSKRPVPVSLEGKRQSVDEHGAKRRKLSEGGAKVVKTEAKPQDVAKEIEKAVGSALVHLAPSTTTAVKVGRFGLTPEQLQANVETVVQALVEKYVPQQWRNVKSIHIKGPNTAALPIWLAEELWVDEADVLDEPLPVKEKAGKKKSKKLGQLSQNVEGKPDVIEVPGPDGKMRRVVRPGTNVEAEAETAKKSKKRKSEAVEDDGAAGEKRAQKEARKAALKKQKEDAKKNVPATAATVESSEVAKGRAARRPRIKAADVI